MCLCGVGIGWVGGYWYLTGRKEKPSIMGALVTRGLTVFWYWEEEMEKQSILGAFVTRGLTVF